MKPCRLAAERRVQTDRLPGQFEFVDPKKFDKRSMVDFKGDICVIPPNSFALAKTVEYFRIPRKILTMANYRNCRSRYLYHGRRRTLCYQPRKTAFKAIARCARGSVTRTGASVLMVTSPPAAAFDELVKPAIDINSCEKGQTTPSKLTVAGATGITDRRVF